MERTVPFARFSNRNNPHEVTGLIYVVVDEHGVAYTAFCLSESAKDPNPHQTLRVGIATIVFSLSLDSTALKLNGRIQEHRFRLFQNLEIRLHIGT